MKTPNSILRRVVLPLVLLLGAALAPLALVPSRADDSSQNSRFFLPLASNPTALRGGQVFYSTASNVFKGYNGSTWKTFAYSDSITGPTLFSGQYNSALANAGSSGTSKTVDWNSGNVQYVTLTGNVTFTFSNPVSGGRYVLILKQDAIGSRTATWPASVLWSGGTAPTLTTTASKVDIITFVYEGVNSKYYGGSVLNF